MTAEERAENVRKFQQKQEQAQKRAQEQETKRIENEQRRAEKRKQIEATGSRTRRNTQEGGRVDQVRGARGANGASLSCAIDFGTSNSAVARAARIRIPD